MREFWKFYKCMCSHPVELRLRERQLRRHRRRAGGILRLSEESAAVRTHQLFPCHQPGGTVSETILLQLTRPAVYSTTSASLSPPSSHVLNSPCQYPLVIHWNACPLSTHTCAPPDFCVLRMLLSLPPAQIQSLCDVKQAMTTC